jgi:hypothetical protein
MGGFMRKIEIEAYTFSELAEKVQKKIIERERESYPINPAWYNFIIEDQTKILEILGFSDIKISFSGFSSQGDGASFTGKYSYWAEWKKELTDYAPDTIKEGEKLEEIQKKAAYSLSATITRNGIRYVHENSVSMDVELDGKEEDEIFNEIEIEFREWAQNYMRGIYEALEEEYESLTSYEYIKEDLENSDLEYTEEGKKI